MSILVAEQMKVETPLAFRHPIVQHKAHNKSDRKAERESHTFKSLSGGGKNVFVRIISQISA